MEIESAHSPLGPSRWPRFVRCPGSVQAEAGLPQRDTYYADEGTAFHGMVSFCLQFGFDPEEVCSKGHRLAIGNNVFEFDGEMANAARDGIDYIRNLMLSDSNWQLFVETRVDISPWVGEGEFGTADVILLNVPEKHIVVFDWKYGKGVPVYVEDDYQTRGYALGVWKTLASHQFEGDCAGVKVTLVIEQPRIPGAGGSVETTMGELLDFGSKVSRQSGKARGDNAVRVAGEKQCRDCLANTKCGTFAEWHLNNLGISFEDLDSDITIEQLPDQMTPERRSVILRARSMFNKWLDSLHSATYLDAEMGNPTPGLKLVKGRHPARTYSDPRSLELELVLFSELGDGAFVPRSLLSPSQAEKELKKVRYQEVLAKFVLHGEPKLILVPEEDKRIQVTPVVNLFEDLEG